MDRAFSPYWVGVLAHGALPHAGINRAFGPWPTCCAHPRSGGRTWAAPTACLHTSLGNAPGHGDNKAISANSSRRNQMKADGAVHPAGGGRQLIEPFPIRATIGMLHLPFQVVRDDQELNPNSEIELPQKNTKLTKKGRKGYFSGKLPASFRHSESARLALCSLYHYPAKSPQPAQILPSHPHPHPHPRFVVLDAASAALCSFVFFRGQLRFSG